jgi:hypothetical protein
MVCEHLIELENELLSSEVKEMFRGQAWSDNCREWVYFDCYLNRESLRQRILFDPCVLDHDHLGTHDGHESGFVCSIHKDAIMGVHETHREDRREIK